MAYGLISEEVDTYGPTIQGMKALREAVVSSKKNFPTLLHFVLEGTTVNPQQLSIECNQFARTVDSSDVKNSLLNIASAALKSKESLSLC